MLVIHGTYHWRRRILAVRNDYCLTCAAPRLAYLHRTVDVLHLFFVPVLPLGIWSRWYCGTCGSRPHAQPAVARPLKWIGIALLIVGAITFWATPADRRLGKDNDPVMVWTFRLALPVLAVAAIRHTLRAKAPEQLAAKLRTIQPNHESTCPRCGTTYTVAAPWYRCGRCGLQRRALPPA